MNYNGKKYTIIGLALAFLYFGALGVSNLVGCQTCTDILTPLGNNLPAGKDVAVTQ